MTSEITSRTLTRHLRKFDPRIFTGAVGGDGLVSGFMPPTVFVAAFDASDNSKALAGKWICTGENDQVVIQAAIDSIPGGIEGRVLLSEGSFNLVTPPSGSAIYLNSIMFQGMGDGATYVNDDAASDPGDSILIEVDDFTQIKDMWIWCGWEQLKAVSGGAGNGIIRLRLTDCVIETSGAPALHADQGFEWYICNNRLYNFEGELESVIAVTNLVDSWITQNFITGGKHCIEVGWFGTGVFPHDLHIAHNFLWSPGESFIWFDGGSTFQMAYTFITGNFCQAGGQYLSSHSDTGAIHLIGDITDGGDISAPNDASEPCIFITGNIVESTSVQDGIHVVHLHGAMITDNYGDSIDGHQIVLEDTSGATVSGNKFFWVAIGDTWDALRITGISSENFIHHNFIQNDVDPFPTLFNSGIHIVDSTCVNNIVVANRLGANADYNVDALTDSGTGTILEYPSDATYGDNFVS